MFVRKSLCCLVKHIRTSDIGTVWFWVNTLYSTTELAEIDTDNVDTLVLQSNVVYRNDATCMWCEEAPTGWTAQPNPVRPFRAPPSAPVRP